MQFTSFSFILFAALLLIVYYLVPRRTQWWVLLAASIGFYAFAGWECMIFILYTAVVTYLKVKQYCSEQYELGRKRDYKRVELEFCHEKAVDCAYKRTHRHNRDYNDRNRY